MTREKDKESHQPQEEPSFVNMRWQTFSKETVEKCNGNESSVQDSSCRGCSGCGCGGE